MKVFRVRFTTNYGLTPFGEIPEYLQSSEILNLSLKFYSGGWNKGDASTCFHEWKWDGDQDIIQNFLENQYGKSLIDITIIEEPQQDMSGHTDKKT